MTFHSNSSHSNNTRQLAELVDALCEGEISQAQLAHLEELLRSDAEARNFYTDHMQLIADFEWRYASDGVPSLLPGDFSPRTERIGFAQNDSIAPSKKVAVPRWPLPAGLFSSVFRSISWQNALPILVLGMLMVGVGFYLGAKTSYEAVPTVVMVEQSDRETSSKPQESVATLQSTSGATWRDSKLPTAPGSRLVPGTLRLQSGVAEIEFDNGAIVAVCGPATLDIQSQDRGFLRSGKLLAHVPSSAIGFKIKTPAGTVVDLGTDFGVIAGASQRTGSIETEVHVFKGEVELTPQSNGVSLAPQRLLVEGEAVLLELLRNKNNLQDSFAWHQTIADRSSFSHIGFAVPLQNATAAFSQKTSSQEPDGMLDVSNMVDPDPTNGWAIGGIGGVVGSDSVAVVETVTDFGFGSGTLLTFTLEQLRNAAHNLGRFRLSVTTDDRSLFGKGIAIGGDVSATWTVLDPLTFSSSGGATMTKLNDKSLLLGGTNPTYDTYTVTTQTMLTGITGFRLEVLTDASLPLRGPGRHPTFGNFVLTHFGVIAVPLNSTRAVVPLPESK